MSEDVEYTEFKDRIVNYLRGVGGKGVDTTMNIAKGTGMSRKEASKTLLRMEMEGVVKSAGVTAGVAGYKLAE